MENFVTWCLGFGRDFMTRLKNRSRAWWLVVTALLLSGLWVVQNRWANTADPVFVWVFGLLGDVLKAPLWAGGVFLVGYLAVLLTMAYIAMRPKSLRTDVTETVSRTEPTPIEHMEIEAARQFWTQDSQDACDNVAVLLVQAVEYFGHEGNPFACLLGTPIGKLQTAKKAFLTVLATEPPSLKEVQDALVTLQNEYGLAACWLNRCLFVDDSFASEPHYRDVLGGWRQVHQTFVAEYSRLRQRKNYESVLPPPLNASAADIQFRGEGFVREDIRKSRARVLAEKMTAVTKDEEAFLAMFCIESNPPLLGNAVYRAGEGLAAKGILTKSERDKTTVRFSLLELSMAAWQHTPMTSQPVRKVIDIDLGKVEGTGSSGGGARGGLSQLIPPSLRPSAPYTEAHPPSESAS